MGVMNDLLTTDLFPQAALPVALRGHTDFEGFRRAARSLLAQQMLPDQVSWHSTGASLQDLARQRGNARILALVASQVRKP